MSWATQEFKSKISYNKQFLFSEKNWKIQKLIQYDMFGSFHILLQGWNNESEWVKSKRENVLIDSFVPTRLSCSPVSDNQRYSEPRGCGPQILKLSWKSDPSSAQGLRLENYIWAELRRILYSQMTDGVPRCLGAVVWVVSLDALVKPSATYSFSCMGHIPPKEAL